MVSKGIQMGFVVVVVAYGGMDVREEKTTSGTVTVLYVAVCRVPSPEESPLSENLNDFSFFFLSKDPLTLGYP